MRKINLGILAASDIAGFVAPTIKKTESINLTAIASRNGEKAKAFAEKHGIDRAYGSYGELLADPDIDLIYITTPHGLHADNIKECINAEKHVICEKAFTLNEREAEEVLNLAEEKGVMVCEAIWQRYTPMAKLLKDFIDSGKLGKINAVSANLGYSVWDKERVHNRSLGGGALLDVGIYTLNFIDIVTNGQMPSAITVNAEIDSENRVDKYETVLLSYDSGITATAYNSLITRTDRRGVIYGSSGFAVIENVNNFESLRFYANADNGNLTEEISAPDMISGYEYEFESAAKAIINGRLETEECPHSQTLRLMRLMDMIRKETGVCYDADSQ